MSKSQNRSMGNRRRQGNTTLQKVNYTIEDLIEGNETSISKFKRMIITMFEEFKEDIQNQVSEFLENTYKKA
jgi:hypothetical protein